MTIKQIKKTYPLMVLSCLILFAILIVVPAAALTITESPDHIAKGDRVTLSLKGLDDNAAFSLLIEGRFPVAPGSSFTFATTNFQMPISLTNGEMTAYTENSQKTMMTVEKGNVTVSEGKRADANGIISISEKHDVSAGTYEAMTLTGTALPGKTSLVTRLQLTGKKVGPANSEISFNVDGIDAGTLILTVLVNDQQQLFKEITIGSTTQAGFSPLTTQQLIPTATPVVTGTPTNTTADKTFSSVDGKVSILAHNTDYAGILKIAPKTIPDGWIAVSDPYTISPDTLIFSPAADLSFTLPDPGSNNYAYFIARYRNGQWTSLTSSPAQGSVGTKIQGAGTYALMALKAESTAPSSAPANGMAETSAPRIASFALAPSQGATPAPTQSPLLPIITAAGLLAAILIYKRIQS